MCEAILQHFCLHLCSDLYKPTLTSLPSQLNVFLAPVSQQECVCLKLKTGKRAIYSHLGAFADKCCPLAP